MTPCTRCLGKVGASFGGSGHRAVDDSVRRSAWGGFASRASEQQHWEAWNPLARFLPRRFFSPDSPGSSSAHPRSRPAPQIQTPPAHLAPAQR